MLGRIYQFFTKVRKLMPIAAIALSVGFAADFLSVVQSGPSLWRTWFERDIRITENSNRTVKGQPIPDRITKQEALSEERRADSFPIKPPATLKEKLEPSGHDAVNPTKRLQTISDTKATKNNETKGAQRAGIGTPSALGVLRDRNLENRARKLYRSIVQQEPSRFKKGNILVLLSGKVSPGRADARLLIDRDGTTYLKLRHVDDKIKLMIGMTSGQIRQLSYQHPQGLPLQSVVTRFKITAVHDAADKRSDGHAHLGRPVLVELEYDPEKQIILRLEKPAELLLVEIEKTGGGYDLALGDFFVN